MLKAVVRLFMNDNSNLKYKNPVFNNKSILHCCRAINIDGTLAFLFNCLKTITDPYSSRRWMSTLRDDKYQEMLFFPYFITRSLKPEVKTSVFIL